MHLRQELVMGAVERLGAFHPFFGITFLVCKQRNLPVGRLISIPINRDEEAFLRDFLPP